MEKLQKDVDRLVEWAAENAMKINPSKIKAIRFTRARVRDPLNYSLMDTLIPEASSCKYLGIKKVLESTTLHNANTKKGNSNTESLA